VTTLQLIAHQEQVEAARIEFDKIWRNEISPRLFRLPHDNSERYIVWTRFLCWHTFLAAKNLKNNR